jgi:hypothetical protein
MSDLETRFAYSAVHSRRSSEPRSSAFICSSLRDDVTKIVAAHRSSCAYDCILLSSRSRHDQVIGAESSDNVWICLIASVAAVPLMYGVGPSWGLWLALIALAVCFTTFCLLYDEAPNRARRRVAAQLGQISSKGVMAEEYQRLQSMTIKTTAEDRKMVLSPMMLANIAAGVLALGLTIWGIALRTM